RLMISKYSGQIASTSQSAKNTVSAFDYTVKNAAKIINYSSRGSLADNSEVAAIKRAQQGGVLFVAAAGKEKSDTDRAKYFPAGYALTNIISVTAHNLESQILPSRNFGFQAVDLAAPGKDIYSAVPGGKFANMTGTSQAAAFVTAAIARVL